MNEHPVPVLLGQEFKITLPITGWVKRSEIKNGTKRDWLILEGYASDTSRDQRGGVFSEGAVLGMIDCVNMGKAAPVWKDVARALADKGEGYFGPFMESVNGDGSVGIDIEHSENWTDQIGYATEARAIYDLTDEQRAAGMQPPVMMVKCAINLNMSHGRDLEEALNMGKKLGMSVYGGVVEGWSEVTRSGQQTDRFEKVALTKIAITQKPANKNMWLPEIKRSMEGVQMEKRDIEGAEAEEAVDVEPTEEVSAEDVASSEPADSAAQETSDAVETDVTAEPSEVVAESEPVETEAEKGEAEVEALADTPADEPAPPRLEDLLPDGGVSQVKEYEAGDISPNLAELLPDGGAALHQAPEEGGAEIVPQPSADGGAESAQAGDPTPPSASDVVASAPIGDTVARSEYLSQTESFRSELAEMRELLSPLRDLVTETTEYRGEVARTQSEVAELRSLLKDIVTEMKSMRSQSMGRRGFVVSRSMGGPVSDAQEDAVLGAELAPGSPERLARLEQIKRELGPAAAVNYMMGNLLDPSAMVPPVIGPAPTLSDIEQKMEAAEAKAQGDAPADAEQA